ncbi:MAG: hypothetical protein SNJ60_02990 [Pseudanabaenaceae cyanobacterium]
MKRLAAIDIGTNSIHMVVADVEPVLASFTIVAAEKETVRLGERCTQTGNLSEVAMGRSLSALKRFREICQTLRVSEIVAVATRRPATGGGLSSGLRRKRGLPSS